MPGPRAKTLDYASAGPQALRQVPAHPLNLMSLIDWGSPDPRGRSPTTSLNRAIRASLTALSVAAISESFDLILRQFAIIAETEAFWPWDRCYAARRSGSY